jgi:hypothetical protein
MSQKAETEKYWLDFFERTDRDKNGVLCIGELKRALIEDFSRTDLTDADIAVSLHLSLKVSLSVSDSLSLTHSPGT